MSFQQTALLSAVPDQSPETYPDRKMPVGKASAPIAKHAQRISC